MSLFDLAGRVALVTGSSRGLGSAIARGLAEAGATVVLNGRDGEAVEAARAGLAAEGLAVRAAPFDVTDPEAAAASVDRIEAGIGPIEILVNNAGIQHRAPLDEFPVAEWRRLMATNLDSLFYVAQAVARRMIPRGRGKIVNIASVTSELGRATIAPYAASKGAVKTLTRAMAADWARHGLQCNAIGPGFFATEMNAALVADPEFGAWLEQRTPARRWGDPKELVGAAVFLASDASSFVNGHVLYVDGGISVTL
jgi:gluconate 5-dehydrogenase